MSLRCIYAPESCGGTYGAICEIKTRQIALPDMRRVLRNQKEPRSRKERSSCRYEILNVKAESYVDWRRDKGTKRPAKKTLMMEIGLIRQALDRAARWSLIKPIPKIKMHALATDPNRERRYGFTADEWQKLTQHMEGWCREGQHNLHKRQRQIVKCLIWFYRLTGMRPRVRTH